MWVDCIDQYDKSKDDNMLQTTVDEIKIGMFQLWIKYLCRGIVYKTGHKPMSVHGGPKKVFIFSFDIQSLVLSL